MKKFDLEQFKKEQIPEPTETDISIFKSLLYAIDSCKSEDYPSILRDKLKEISQFKASMIGLLLHSGVEKMVMMKKLLRNVLESI